jgi:hypothetical protein
LRPLGIRGVDHTSGFHVLLLEIYADYGNVDYIGGTINFNDFPIINYSGFSLIIIGKIALKHTKIACKNGEKNQIDTQWNSWISLDLSLKMLHLKF